MGAPGPRPGLALVAAALVVFAIPRSVAPADPPKVLIIQPETTALPATVLIDQGIRDAFRRLPVEPRVYVEYLDSRRFPGLSQDDELLRWWAHKYRNDPPDLIISVSQLPMRALRRPGQTLWADVPMVFCAVSDYGLANLTLPVHTTGVTYRFAIEETAELIGRLLPDVRRIVAPYGPSAFDLGYREEVRAGMKGVMTPVYEEWNGLTVDEMRERVRQAPADAAVLVLVLSGDDARPSLTPGGTAGVLAQASSRPVFSFFRHIVGNGILGGLAIDPHVVGVRAGELSARILSGEAAGSIPVTSVGPAEPVFDARQLRRFSIPRTALPDGSVVLFEDASVFERYRWQIVSAVTALVGQTALIGVLLEQRRRRMRAEAERRRLEVEHHLHVQEIAHLDRVVSLGALATSLAHELNQPLTAILTNAQAAQALLESDTTAPAEVREALDEIVDDNRRASDIIVRMRRLLKKGDVESAPVDLNVLCRDATRLVSGRASRERVTIENDLSATPVPVVGDAVQLQQVVVNLLLNAIDASREVEERDRRVVIETGEAAGEKHLAVRDSGPGVASAELASVFRPFFSTKKEGLGMGLSISRTIVEAHGGRIWAENGETGAVFRIALPARRVSTTETKVP